MPQALPKSVLAQAQPGNHPAPDSAPIAAEADDLHVELRLLTPEDFAAVRAASDEAFAELPSSSWAVVQLDRLVELWPEGQVVATVNGELAGAAFALRVGDQLAGRAHTYRQATGEYTFSTHDDAGEWLYGIDVFVRPAYRGLRLARRLYDYRKELCERLNLRGIVFGGRLPNYARHAETLSPRQYIDKVRVAELADPVLGFQLANDFHVRRILTGYLEGDADSREYAALLQWDNVLYEEADTTVEAQQRVVRLGLVQWQMRRYADFEGLLEQVEYFFDAVGDYHCDFVLFPEFFNAPLMAGDNDEPTARAIRRLAAFTEPLLERFRRYAVSYNINVVTGSMPEVGADGSVYNAGYLCRRDGTYERYEKIHVTPDEASVWGMRGGSAVRTFDTDCGRVGVLICYDVEFPELGRLLAADGMQLLFVPFLTDTQNGYSRVRHCAQARAIENECYVAIAGAVGNLPRVHNMDMQFAQSVVFTPCDFAFPTNGVKAEATPNTEMILVADVDLDLLKELHEHGAVRNLKDRRGDVYEVRRVGA